MKKELAVILILLVVVVAISGCIEQFDKVLPSKGDNMCKEIEKQQPACKCYPTDFVPENLRNESVVPKCFCMCDIDGKKYNISIVAS